VVARGPERLLASDEGGELAAAPSECNPQLHYLIALLAVLAVLAVFDGSLRSLRCSLGSRRSDSAAEYVSRLDYSRIHVRL
jgi:hypothetical protein